MLQDGKGRQPWTDGHLFLNFVMFQDLLAILQTEAFKLRKIMNTLKATVRKEKTIVDIMKALRSYTGAF